jgi:PEP-CTERM motif
MRLTNSPLLASLAVLLFAGPASAETILWTDHVNTAVLGSTLNKTGGGTGWNADAVSVQHIAMNADASIEWTLEGSLPANNLYMIGFNTLNQNSGVFDLDYAVYVYLAGPGDNHLTAYEDGVDVSSVVAGGPGSFILSGGETIRMQRVNDIVSYHVNDVLWFASPTPSTAEIFVDTSLHYQGTSYINEVTLNAVPEPASLALGLLSLLGLGAARRKVGAR